MREYIPEEPRPDLEVGELGEYVDEDLDMNSLDTYGFGKADDLCN